jgi:polysaccharide pyruvyl transferase WcaK-like protein
MSVSSSSDSRAPIVAALFNDNADYPHVGCQAVSQAHLAMLRRERAVVRHRYFQRDWQFLASGSLEEGIRAALESTELDHVFSGVDAVVVNGEGSIHHRQGWHLLAILGAAQRRGIPTFLVNAVLQDVDAARGVLAAVDDCTVRDARSARYLEMLNVGCRLVPDSFFEARFADEPVHDFAGHLVLTDCHPVRAAEFWPVFEQLRHSWPGPVSDYPLEGSERMRDWLHALADIRSAAAVVTGRHHGVCLALRAGVPFVALPSNTWKVEGFLETLDGYPAGAADSSKPLLERIECAVAARDWFSHAARTWNNAGSLTTLSGLRRLWRNRPGCSSGAADVA